MTNRMVGRAVLALAMFLAMPLFPAAARADEFNSWWTGENMTGDWGGLRDKLEDMGIEIEVEYTAEMAGDSVGGLGQGFRYAHEHDFGGSRGNIRATTWVPPARPALSSRSRSAGTRWTLSSGCLGSSGSAAITIRRTSTTSPPRSTRTARRASITAAGASMSWASRRSI